MWTIRLMLAPATNLRQKLDEAFVRRLKPMVEFPFPDEEYPTHLGVTIPQEAPPGSDVDLAVLARELKLAGGNTNICVLTGQT